VDGLAGVTLLLLVLPLLLLSGRISRCRLVTLTAQDSWPSAPASNLVVNSKAIMTVVQLHTFQPRLP
jgi:hypothetical protein